MRFWDFATLPPHSAERLSLSGLPVRSLELRLICLIRDAPWSYPNSVAYDAEYEA